MRANLAAFLVVHDGLKERTENGRGDARPVLARAGQQRVAHIAVKISKSEVLIEQVAVDVGKRAERFVQVDLPFLGRRVEDFKEPRELFAQIRAIRRGAVLDKEMK